ncbi:MAG: hypothetical protein PHW77_06660 [Eubacteriales bacterium]|nr:hypothetical protein [Eubacteriales bacterium]
MKNVIISADCDKKVFAVPDPVADSLSDYCTEFCDKWLQSNPDAKKHRKAFGILYNEDDFIEYLNTWIFPDIKSVLIKNLGNINYNNIPAEYSDCPRFNF